MVNDSHLRKYLAPLLLLSVVSLTGCELLPSQVTDKSSLGTESQASQVQKVMPQEFDVLAENEDAFILDVHTPKQTHIAGTDAFIAYDQLTQNLAKLPEDKNTPLLVYCRSGSMSDIATKELVSMGYTNVSDLVGGIEAWREINVSVMLTPLSQVLGRVIYGQIATTQFTLTNNTPDPLKITKVSSSCSCTNAEVLDRELEPFESTIIKVSFDPAVHKNDSDLGEVTRTIYISTDNSEFPQLTSTITANVIKEGK